MSDHTNAHTTHLGAVFDAHVKHEFVDHDVGATMGTMVVGMEQTRTVLDNSHSLNILITGDGG